MADRYHVHMFNAGPPLSILNLTGNGAEVRKFDALSDARAFAEEQRSKWRSVVIRELTEDPGVFNEIERYQEGRRY